MTSPQISVVICTYNRGASLGNAIDSVLAQDIPSSSVELIVVDNGSTDATASIVAGYGDRVRNVREPTLGLSHARNTGWRRARAPLVALLDDDAIAEPGWLNTMIESFSVAERPACVGGRVIPQFQSPRPSWLSDKLALSLTVADWSETPRAIRDLTCEWLVGANIAFRRDVLERLGGFSPRLGRNGSRLLSGEEILLQRRLLDEGSVCWYAPQASVRHLVTDDRLSASWFRRRYFAQGQSDAAIWRLERRPGGESAFRMAVQQAAPILRAGFGLPDLLFEPGDPAEFTEHCGVLWRMGYVAGLMAGA